MGREALVVLLRSLVVEYLGRSPWVVITSRRITRFLVKYGFRHGRWEYIIIEGALRCLAGRVGGVDYTRRSAGRVGSLLPCQLVLLVWMACSSSVLITPSRGCPRA
ncbi:hypothetical protein [Vulcanisaeta distributa]|uniref:hypothetical protein n=1 Tax=Vulcanisaeta distributa TaxID=164451 RepID=UPI0006D18123|nr:hypothetical protein [Vulcanisaeta distributa]